MLGHAVLGNALEFKLDVDKSTKAPIVEILKIEPVEENNPEQAEEEDMDSYVKNFGLY